LSQKIIVTGLSGLNTGLLILDSPTSSIQNPVTSMKERHGTWWKDYYAGDHRSLLSETKV